MPRRSRYIFVCTKRRPEEHKKGSCALHASEELLSELKLAAGKAGLDVKVTSSGCFDLCWVGAAIAVMPDAVFLKSMTVADVPRLVAALSTQSGPALEERMGDHVARAVDFVDPSKGK